MIEEVRMKFKSMKSVLIAVTIFGLPSLVFGDLITSEDFETGATGWSNNTTTNGGSTFTNFLGRFSNTQSASKTYTLSGTQTAVTIEFDFYEIDSWDAGQNDTFYVSINGDVVISDTYQHKVDDSGKTFVTSTLFGNGTENIAFSGWSDQGFHYSYTFYTTETSLTLCFSSSLTQGTSDESWGIDNVKITDNVSAVPVPSSVLLGLVGLAPVIRRRRATK